MSRFLEADDGVALSPCVGLDSTTESCEHPVVSYLSLIVVCMASWKVAFFVAKWMALPRGSGFLLTGLLANAVSMLDNHSCQDQVTIGKTQLSVYFPLNYLCMSFIAYATGSELILERYRGFLKRIVITTSCIMILTFMVITFVLFGVLSTLDDIRMRWCLQQLHAQSPSERLKCRRPARPESARRGGGHGARL